MRLGALGIAVVLVLSGCATSPARQAADRAACAKLVAAVKTALESGSAPLDPETIVERRNVYGGPARAQVSLQLDELDARLAARRSPQE